MLQSRQHSRIAEVDVLIGSVDSGPLCQAPLPPWYVKSVLC